jgi:hypothetical protein
MKTVHTVKVSDLSTMERDAWEHIMKAALGPHTAVNGQYAIAFALMSISDTMATNCKALHRAVSALENMESDGVSNVKTALNNIADAVYRTE